MHVAFRKTDNSCGLQNKIINFGTGNCGFHHVELVFDDGISFSADSTEDVQVRFKNIDYSSKKDTWELVKLPDGLHVENMKMFADTQVGKRYDWKGLIFNFILPVGLNGLDTWFCSEIVSETLKYGGDIRLAGHTAHGLSPNSLYSILTGKDVK